MLFLVIVPSPAMNFSTDALLGSSDESLAFLTGEQTRSEDVFNFVMEGV
jgi:hypothetical protein